MDHPNTPCIELKIDICKTKRAAISRADQQTTLGRRAAIYTTDGMQVNSVEENATNPAGALSVTVIAGTNTAGDRWVVASWRAPA
jgi:hypothetical protein